LLNPSFLHKLKLTLEIVSENADLKGANLPCFPCAVGEPGFLSVRDFAMRSFAAAGAGLLLAVLWFDLMFDVQTRKAADDALPPVAAM
jgi:hypothetical protein